MTYDTIAVHNLEIRGRHGVYEEERAEGRRFAFDAEVDVPAQSAGTTDALGRTVDYRDIAQIIVDVVDGPSVHLIETLAEEICARVLKELSVERVRLAIRKYATGVPGDPEWVGLRIEREQA
ncbi:MAG: dihydroneopterin aldolase [Bradymonadia bacterium]|jgi:dihydroneopterin aldolase